MYFWKVINGSRFSTLLWYVLACDSIIFFSFIFSIRLQKQLLVTHTKMSDTCFMLFLFSL